MAPAASRLAIAAVGALVATLYTFGNAPANAQTPSHHGAKPNAAKTRKAAPAPQRATVTIDHGYQPATVAVKVGRPVQLTLVRKETGGCGDVVNFPTLGIKRTLKAGQKTVVTFTPKKAGTVAFTCGMNMYKGQVVAR